MSINTGIIKFGGYRIQHIEYECAASFIPDQIEGGTYRYNIAHGSAQFEDKSVQVNLLVHAFYNNTEDYDSAPYKIMVEIAGKFIMADGSDWDEKWLPNAIAILYPYVRAIVGSVTSQSGRETITLPTINTQSLLDNE